MSLAEIGVLLFDGLGPRENKDFHECVFLFCQLLEYLFKLKSLEKKVTNKEEEIL